MVDRLLYIQVFDIAKTGVRFMRVFTHSQFFSGAIILLDARFNESRNTEHLSKWVQKYIARYMNFHGALESLDPFFQNRIEEYRKLAAEEAARIEASQMTSMLDISLTASVVNSDSTDIPIPTQIYPTVSLDNLHDFLFMALSKLKLPKLSRPLYTYAVTFANARYSKAAW